MKTAYFVLLVIITALLLSMSGVRFCQPPIKDIIDGPKAIRTHEQWR